MSETSEKNRRNFLMAMAIAMAGSSIASHFDNPKRGDVSVPTVEQLQAESQAALAQARLQEDLKRVRGGPVEHIKLPERGSAGSVQVAGAGGEKPPSP